MQQEINLKLLKIIENNPEITQRELSQTLGVSLGKVNYCLKALKEKGLVKWGNFSNNPHKAQYLHLLTPKGAAEKLIMTSHFLNRKLAEYEKLKMEIEALRVEVKHVELTKTVDGQYNS